MKSYRAYLLGGVCLGLLTLTSGAKDGPSAPSATGANAKTGVLIVAENEAPAADPAPPSTPPGVTEYYGDTTPKSPPAFAAEAAMNPDYAAAPAALAEAPAAETAAAEAVAVAEEAPPPMTPPGVTEYYGDTAAASTAPFSAEATMNADYAAAPAAADGGAPAEAPADEAAPAPAATAEEAPPPMTPPGVTEYYGDTAAASTAPFSAEATMNADYAAEPAAPAAAAVEETPPPMTPPGVTEYYGDTTPK
ncbi:MAG: hypothetical protein ABL907_01010, partial [Hyphomicrobium sp.]